MRGIAGGVNSHDRKDISEMRLISEIDVTISVVYYFILLNKMLFSLKKFLLPIIVVKEWIDVLQVDFFAYIHFNFNFFSLSHNESHKY